MCVERGLNGFEWFWAIILVDFGPLGVDLSVRRARSERFGVVLAVILVDSGQLGVDLNVRRARSERF